MPDWKRLLATFRPHRRNAEIDDELEFHIEMRAADLMRQGVPEAEAFRQARTKFGSRARIVEETRETHLLRWLDTFLRESRLSLRALRRRPAFLFAGLATLTLGIGANVAVFSLLDGLVLKPLPVPNPDRLMAVVETRNGEPTGGNPARLRDYAQSLGSVSAISGFYGETLVVRGTDSPLPLRALRLVGDVAGTFGYRPVLGRLPGPEEPGAGVIGHRYWERTYGRDPGVIGKVLQTQAGGVEIVGVLGPEAALIEDYDLWLPAGRDILAGPRTAGFLQVVARLKPAADPARANAELATLSAAVRAANPDADKGLSAVFKPFGAVLAADVDTVYLAFAVVLVVLLIACANLAGLILARNAERTREASIRIAIGATRGDLLRLYLLESLWLTVPGGLLGGLAGAWTLTVAKSFLPADLPLLATVALDLRAVLFAAGLTLFCALAIGLLPAYRAPRLRGGFVVGQVAVSLVLLAAAAVLGNAFLTARQRPLGFQSDRVVAVQFALPWDTDGDKLLQFYRDTENAARSVPGVRTAGFIDRLPLEGGTQGRGYLRIHGRNLSEAEARRSYGLRAVTPGAVEALRIPLAAGRLPDPRQRELLINTAFAKRYFGAESPVGQRVSLTDAARTPEWYTIAGVLENVAQNSVETSDFCEVFVHFERTFWPHGALVASMEGDPAALIAAVRRVDPFALIRFAGPLDSRLEAAWSEPRATAGLLGGFSLAALALACIGLYGLLAADVRARAKEFGIRMALGAAPSTLVQTALWKGLRLTGLGLALGLAAAWPLSGAAAAPAAALLAASAFAACYLPARRAARLDPASVLRQD